MAETETHDNSQATAPDTIAQLLDVFEDEHHHPRSGLLWVVLLAFTLVEVGAAFFVPTDQSVKADQFLRGGQDFAKAIVAEAEADSLAISRRQDASGKFKADQLALSGRPGYRLMKLMTPEQRKSVRDLANYEVKDPEAAKVELVTKSTEFAEILTGFVDQVNVFHPDAFSAVGIGMAVQQKISFHRRGKVSFFDEFLGEASIAQLNRTLLEQSYPHLLRSPNTSVLLILSLLACALLKAFVVGVYFMHGRYEGTWLQILLVPSCTLAMVVIVFLSPDVGMVHHTTWAVKFLLPGALVILVAMFSVLQLTKRPDIPTLEPAEH